MQYLNKLKKELSAELQITYVEKLKIGKEKKFGSNW